jgi:hypothetical protein
LDFRWIEILRANMGNLLRVGVAKKDCFRWADLVQ